MKKLICCVKKFCFLFFLGTIVVGCTPPEIHRQIYKAYDPAESGTYVKVFLKERDIPYPNENLGVIVVYDSGFSARCDSTSVLNIIKEEVRKVGGDAVYLSEIMRPSSESSCYQMTAIALKTILVADNKQSYLLKDRNLDLSFVKVSQKRWKLPPMNVGLNVGYSKRFSQHSSFFNDIYTLENNKEKNGVVVNANFQFYFSDYVGVGLLYNGFLSVKNTPFYESTWLVGASPRKVGDYRSIDLISFLGPEIIYRYPIGNKFNIGLAFGVGIMFENYREDILYEQWYLNQNREAESSLRNRVNGIGYGMFCNLDFEYRIQRDLGIVMNFQPVGGWLNKLKRSSDNYVIYNKLGNIGHLDLSIGLRYHILYSSIKKQKVHLYPFLRSWY